MKINWKAKLTSRKFWAAIIAFVTTILMALNVDQLTVTQIVSILGGVATMCVYILGESVVDAARIKSPSAITSDPVVASTEGVTDKNE